MIRRWAGGLIYTVGLIAILGVATVQSSKYLHDFVTYPSSSAVMFGAAFLCGLAAGVVSTNIRVLLVLPLLIVLGGGLVFFAVAYSPVWAGVSESSVAIINDLTRQVIILIILNMVPTYFGAIVGGFLGPLRQA